MKKSKIIVSASVLGAGAITLAVVTAVIAGEMSFDEKLSSIESQMSVLSEGDNAKANDLRIQGSRLISESLARPAENREIAINNIKKLVGDKSINVEYMSTAPSSYDGNILCDYYRVDEFNYAEVSMRTNEVVQFGPDSMDKKQMDAYVAKMQTTERAVTLSQNELSKKAANFITDRALRFDTIEANLLTRTATADTQKLGQNFDLTTLSSSIDIKVFNEKDEKAIEKGDANFFFRWEGEATRVKSGAGLRTEILDGEEHSVADSPFIQVGFNGAGELVSYTNTFGL